ncbi:syntaxin-like protein [Lyophyllum atratum]|nr:syntaxin-like protein [Lyophyllum atratum]
MSRDRLTAARALPRDTVPEAHDMDNLAARSNVHGTADAGTSSDFFAEVSSIQEGIEQMNSNVTQIATLHARILTIMDDGRSNDVAQLDQLAAETQKISKNVKERIKALQQAGSALGTQMRRNQMALLQSKFVDTIQNYQRVEQEYRHKSRQRVERQLRIVKPDATSEEVAAAYAEGGGQQIFAQVLSSSSRYGESRVAFREVQERQQEIKKMEQTLAEIAQLLSDMATLIDQQEETIDHVETIAEQEDTWKAIISARRHRTARWTCFAIFLVIIIVIIAVIAWKYSK